MNLTYILWALFIGLGIASVYTFYTKMVLGILVKKLIDAEAKSPDTAISLELIQFKMNVAVKNALRKGTSFSETVRVDENNNYYIDPNELDKAKIKYRDEGTSIYVLLIFLVVLAASALICIYIFPDIIQKFNDFISSFS